MTSPPEPLAADQTTSSPRRDRRRLLIAAGVLLVVIAGAGVALALALGGREAGPGEVAEKSCTERFVPAKLKAPATARFSDVSSRREGDSGYVTVTGSVDAQNAFGAFVRSPFKCYVHVENGTARMISVDAG